MKSLHLALASSVLALSLPAMATNVQKTITGPKARALMEAAANAGYSVTPKDDAPIYLLSTGAFYCVYAFQELPESMRNHFFCAKGTYQAEGKDQLDQAGLLVNAIESAVLNIGELALTENIIQIHSVDCTLKHANNTYSCAINYYELE